MKILIVVLGTVLVGGIAAVINAQTQLADAKSALIAALADYQIAQVDIAVATGTVLGKARVDWAPTTQPSE